MKTVSEVLDLVYGADANHPEALKVGPSNVSNWRAWGYFPAHIVLQILHDAETRGIAIAAREIPSKNNRVGEAA